MLTDGHTADTTVQAKCMPIKVSIEIINREKKTVSGA